MLSVFPLKGAEFKAQTLCFHDSGLYNQLAEILSEGSEASSFIMNTFRKTCIDELLNFENEKSRISISPAHVDRDELFKLYLDNNYFDLAAILHNFDNPLIKAYYFSLLKTNVSEVNQLVDETKRSIASGDYISTILY